MYYHHHGSDSDWLGVLLGIVIMGLLLMVRGCMREARYEKSDNEWNNGKCESCREGDLKFKNATPETRYSNEKYYYECDKCGHVQFFYKIME